jgi:hypothetical protein
MTSGRMGLVSCFILLVNGGKGKGITLTPTLSLEGEGARTLTPAFSLMNLQKINRLSWRQRMKADKRMGQHTYLLICCMPVAIEFGLAVYLYISSGWR